MAFSSLVLRHFLGEAGSIGAANPEILARILERSCAAPDGFWVADRDMFDIVTHVRRESQTPDLGLRLGARASFTALGPSGLLVSVVESFRQAMRALAHFVRVARDTDDIVVKDTELTLTVEFAGLEGPPQFQEVMTELITSSVAALLARFAGPRARFRRVYFNYPAPSHIAAYEQTFGCELVFKQPHFGVVVDAALADRVQMLSQPVLAQQLWQLAEQQLVQVFQPRTMVDEVRGALRVDWGSPPPRISQLARRLGLSERSLRRRLAEMNVDYRTLVAERQREVATQMLRRPGVSIKEVAHGLGYDSPSAFHRAYKRWTGASPSEHQRANHRAWGPCEVPSISSLIDAPSRPGPGHGADAREAS